MAVVMLDGFDHLSAAQHSGAKGWQGGLNAVFAGRFGGQAGRTVNATVQKNLTSSYSTFIFGHAFYVSVNTSDTILAIRGGATNVVRMQIVTSGATQVLRLINSGGTTLATGTTSITANTWRYCEIKTVVNASTGSVELRLDGSSSPELSASNVNTGSTSIDNLTFTTNNSQQYNFDDFYGVDTTGSAPNNDFLGDCRVETLMGTAEGANTAWTANTGTKVSRVNDSGTYDSDTGYIYSSTPGDRETFTNGSLATTTGTIFAVQTNVVARKDGAATRTIAPVIRKSGVNYDGTTTAALGASYVDYTQLYDKQDPAAVDWTIATVNAMEVGVKEVA